MKKVLKIAIYSGEIPSTTFIERLVIGLSGTGDEVFLFGILHHQPIYSAQVKVIGYKLTRFSKLLHFLRFWILLTLFKQNKKKRLDSYLKEQQITGLYTKVKFYPVLWHQPDVFHIQWAKGLDDWMWVQDFGIRLVLSLRGAHINYSPIADLELAEMFRKNFPKVDGFHAVSKAIAAEATRYGATSNKIKVVYSGLDLDAFKPTGNKQNADFEIISVGRSHWKKGYRYALDAIKILKEQGIQVHYTIIGAKNSEELEFQRSDLGLEAHVALVGNVSFSEVQKRMYHSDLVLLPSIEEGIANVVLEAMQIGTLVLSTDCGGMNEVIEKGKNGFLIPIRHPKRMAEVVIEIMKLSEYEKTAIRQNAKQTIAGQHTETQMISGMLGLYDGL